MIASKKKVISVYLNKKCVNSNKELRSGSFNDVFYRFCLFYTESVKNTIVTLQRKSPKNSIGLWYFKTWLLRHKMQSSRKF